MKTMIAVLAVFTWTQFRAPRLERPRPVAARPAPDAGPPPACDCEPPVLGYPSGGEVHTFTDWNAPACAWQCTSADGGHDCDRDAGLALKGVP